MGIEEQILEIYWEELTEKINKEKDTASIKNLLIETDFNSEKIARVVGVHVDMVEEIKRSLEL